ncbi:MAG: BREX-2 system phosphatase PglZ [Streptosporangiaceae bacterium]
MTEQTIRASVPEASKTVVESALKQALTRAAGRREKHGLAASDQRLLLLRAAPQWHGPATVTADAGQGPVTADVRGCRTVLAVLDAVSEPRPAQTYLVVLTPCDGRELGNSLLAMALGGEVRPVHRWDLVADAFGARKLDPRLTGRPFRWLAEALLDAQPTGGWRRITGPVLQLDTVLSRLAAVRLGHGGEDDRLDAAALLDWTRDETRLARFLALRQEEQDGLAEWLEESAGPVAQMVFRLLRAGQVLDAIPFGLAAAELWGAEESTRQVVLEARIRSEERFLGRHAPSEASLRTFAEAAESLTLRWCENGHAGDAQAMCDRAEQILRELGAGDLPGSSKILDAGLDARITALADQIAIALPVPRPVDLTVVEAAVERLHEHRRRDARAAEVEAGVAALRLIRWLATPEVMPATVAEGALRQVRCWAWVDRALAVIRSADTARTPRVRSTYAALNEAARERRAVLDRAFAERLASWSPVAGPTGNLLLAENLLERVARPLADRRAPLIIVLDGMSAAVACELAEEITASRIWTETGRYAEGREGAIAVLPSATTFSRTSLLCGQLRSGSQPQERAGFATFWHGRKAMLFHKAGLAAGPGAVLNEDVHAAISDSAAVVCVVLNTIDDTLRDGREGSAPAWRLDDVTYLRELLSAAAGAGRPVILTSDHGHVLDHGGGIHPAASQSARYRQGQPGEGEVLVSGPRVLSAEGSVVLAWDERIRYGPRKAGYHGGASLAEVIIPVLAFVPAATPGPKGWTLYDNPALHEPTWWNGDTAPSRTSAVGQAPTDQVPAAGQPSRARKPPKRVPAQEDTLFSAGDIPGHVTLGARVVASERFAAQRAFVRKAPADAAVVAIIDGLSVAGGKLPVSSVAELSGQASFRMAGYLAQLGRLLNVDGYPVIGDIDSGRTVELNTALLTEQFLGP